MADIDLAMFNRIASGKYNAGQIDFETDGDGKKTGWLVKINNHVHKIKKSENNVVLSPERVMEVKEAFIKALWNGGVRGKDLAAIRLELGMPEKVDVDADAATLKSLAERRMVPLSRSQVRTILDKYANSGTGWIAGSNFVSEKEIDAADKAGKISGKNAAKRDAVNAENNAKVDNSAMRKVSRAIAFLGKIQYLSDIQDGMASEIDQANAVNEKAQIKEALGNQFIALFEAALKLLDAPGADSAKLFICGTDVTIGKTADGKLSATVGKGVNAIQLKFKTPVKEFVGMLAGRAVANLDTLGADKARLLLNKIFERDTQGLLTGRDRTSLSRQFAAFIISNASRTDPDVILKGNYNTGALVEIAELALDGKVPTKARLDAFHDEIGKGNANLSEEMQQMLEKVADMPLEHGDGNELVVTAPIVGDIDNVIAAHPVPKAPPVAIVQQPGMPAITADDIKNFIADIVFSDDTLVSDVIVDMPGETMRNILSSDPKKMLALAEIAKNPAIIDVVASPVVAGAVKTAFQGIIASLQSAYQKAYNTNETLAQAAARPQFIHNFTQMIISKELLPGKELAKFEAALQTMANTGMNAIQGFINDVFNIKPDDVQKNDRGGLTAEPYKNKSEAQIKTELTAKSLNQILDDASSDASAPGQVGLFKQVLSDYFVNMHRNDKRSTFAAALRYANVFDFAGKNAAERQSAERAATAKFAGAVLKGTSPLLQKMMQGIPKSVMGDFADALEDMKCNLTPIPRKIVQAHFNDMIAKSNGKIKSITLKKSLGAASVGEAFLCSVEYASGAKAKKEDVVIKIMRHDAEARVEREAKIFTAAAGKIGPGMAKTWEGQLKQYMKEFDFTLEANNITTGAKLYDVRGSHNHKNAVIAPTVGSMKISKLIPPSKNAIVCTLERDDTVDRHFKKAIRMIQDSVKTTFQTDPATGRLKWDPVTKKPLLKPVFSAYGLGEAKMFCKGYYGIVQRTQQSIAEASKLWFHEAFLGSGKFHGDCHAGNFMISSQGENISFIDFGNLFELKIHYELDGNGNQIMETVTEKNAQGQDVQVQRPKVRLNERVELLRLILGATLRDKKFFLDGLENLLSPEGKANLAANRGKAEAILDAILSKGRFSYDVCYRLQGALSELQKLGLELPPQIYCFVQSMTRLQNTMAEMNTILNQTKAIIETLADMPELPPDHQRDKLDFIGRLMDMNRTPEGKEIVEYDDFMMPPDEIEENGGSTIIELPASVKTILDAAYGNVNLSDSKHQYFQQLLNELKTANDPVAVAERAINLYKSHLNAETDIQAFNILARLLADFKANIANAQGEYRDAVILDFTKKFLGTMHLTIRGMAGTAREFVKIDISGDTKSFSGVVMSTLFDGGDAMEKMFQKNFTAKESGALKADALGIAGKELGVNIIFGNPLTLADRVQDAIVEDTRKQAGDNSYQINVGV